MAVTQQFARPSNDQLAICRESVEELHRLCSFGMLPPEYHLYLHWSPAALVGLGELTTVEPAIQ